MKGAQKTFLFAYLSIVCLNCFYMFPWYFAPVCINKSWLVFSLWYDVLLDRCFQYNFFLWFLLSSLFKHFITLLQTFKSLTISPGHQQWRYHNWLEFSRKTWVENFKSIMVHVSPVLQYLWIPQGFLFHKISGHSPIKSLKLWKS